MRTLLREIQLKRFIIAALLLAALSPAATHWSLAATTTYYVAPTGSDSNPGTQAAPFQTLKMANSVVQAGDTVLFRGGTYMLTDTNWIGTSGTAAARIAFQAYPGEHVVFDGSALPSGSDAISIGGSYIDFIGMEISNAQAVGLSIWGGAHVRILNNIIHGSQLQAIWSGYTDFTTVNDILIDSNTVYNNVLKNSVVKSPASHPSAIISHRASNVHITNNLVYENYGEGIDPVLTKGGVVAGNTVHDNYAANIYLDNATDFRVEGNFVYTTNDARFYENSSPAPAIMIANENYDLLNPSQNITVTNNILVGARFNFGYGDYLLGGGLRNLVFANNTLANATESAFHIDGNPNHSNLLFVNNIVAQPAGKGQMLASWNGTAGYQSLTFHHNLWFGSSPGIAAGPGDVVGDPLLLNAAGSNPADYRLQSGSPAINAGAMIAAVVADYWGTCRPQAGTYDIGAQEFSAGISGVTQPSSVAQKALAAPLHAQYAQYLPLVQSSASSLSGSTCS